jgi:hypothetical protein
MGKSKKSSSRKKKKTRKNKTVRLNCSPQENPNSFSCYTNDNLTNMRDLWNEKHAHQRIVSTKPKKIWEFLKHKYETSCKRESCWIRHIAHQRQSENDLFAAFAPQSPNSWKENPNEWLSNFDIQKVMKQYEKRYKCFEFIGPSPIDFDTVLDDGKCVWVNLCKFNLQEQFNRKKTKIGFIFNTDKHDKGGSHWVSLFLNLRSNKIFYYDSVGARIPPQIKVFVDRVTKEGEKLKKPIHLTFDENYPVEHQKGNTECGMYSLYFIVHMLEDKINGEYLKTHHIPDKYIEGFRQIYYNPEL